MSRPSFESPGFALEPFAWPTAPAFYRAWLRLGVVAVLLLPEARASHALLGWLPFWLLGNYFLERFYGLPRLSRLTTALAGETREGSADNSLAAAELSTDAASAPKPRFLQRLDRLAGLNVSELVAVEAEDHYIHVHSRRGKELIYYRFGDALEELRTLRGIQIHRSAWVSIDGIQTVEDRGRKTHVVLITGERLRVSLPNRGALLRLRQASAPA